MKRKANRKTSSKSYERKPVAITPVEYGGLQAAYDHFNKELFGGELPDVMIVLQRKSHSGGHFAPNRFAGRSAHFAKHELSLNPDGFVGQSDEFICSILNHEMTHCWQDCFGAKKRKRYSYHDREWAAKMESIGLQPSNSGMVGGKRTGVHMQHYILEDGPFQASYAKLARTGWRLNLQSAVRPGPNANPKNSKTKFTCGECGQNAWGKPDLKIRCDDCNVRMKSDATVIQSYDQAA
jgi:hypothetical protein